MKQITKWKKYSIQVSLYLIRRLKILHNQPSLVLEYKHSLVNLFLLVVRPSYQKFGLRLHRFLFVVQYLRFSNL